ncbi:unnamed protein product [Cochlearia groenlandica]
MLRLTIIIVIVISLSFTRNVKGGSVFVYNDMREYHILKIHCKSGDTDFGFRVRRPGGDFHFKFRDNVFEKTLYWCNLWYGPKAKYKQGIIAYEGKRLPHNNNWVRWSVRESGIYESVNGKTPFVYKYGWSDQFKN